MRILRYMLLTAVLLTVSTAVRAQFNPGNPAEPQTLWQLTVKADPADAATVTGGGRYASGTSVKVSATATDTRWELVNWTDGAGNVKSTAASFNYTTTYGPVTLTAHYREVATSTLTLMTNLPGAGTLSGAGRRAVGAKANVTASVASDFTFVNWTDEHGTVLSINRSFTYTHTEDDATLTANYRYTPRDPSEPSPTKAKHRVWFTCDPAGSATFNRTSGGDAVAEEASYSVRVTPASQFSFTGWTDADTGESLSTEQTLTFNMGTADRHLVAHCVFHPDAIVEPGTDTKERYALYGFNHHFFNGQTTLYPIYLENTGSVTSLTFTLVLPTALTAGEAHTTLRTSGYTVSTTSDNSAEGCVRYTYTLTGGSVVAGHNGKVLEIALAAADETVVGTFPLHLEGGSVTLDNGARTLALRDGTAEVDVDESDLLAAFTYEQYMDRVQFTDQSIHAQGVEWRFGDGAVDTIPNPMHIYAEPGTYHVTLTAFGALTQNVAEKVIVINAPSTWTAEGDFTLDHERRSARNFTSLAEMMTMLLQCQITGNISVAVRDNTNYTLDTSAEGVMPAMETITAALGSTYSLLFSTADDPVTLSFTTDGTSEALTKTFRLMQHMQGTNVTFLIDGYSVDASLLSSQTSQTVVTRGTTTAVPFSQACSSEFFNVNWQLTLASSTVSGYETSGTGDIPAMTLISTSRTQGSVIYAITATLGDSPIYTGSYTFYVNPCQEVDASDLEALTTFYTALGGTTWTKKWNTENAAIDGNWTGVTFDADGHVTAIALANNNLGGALPDEGLTLPYLTSLNLSSNALTGDIASFVAEFPQLTTLNLSRNKFTALDAALPTTLTNVDLGYQYANADISDLPSQTLALAPAMEPEIGSLLGYNAASQDFTAHPQLRIYTESDNRYLGALNYTDGMYRLSLNGNYQQPSGTAVKLTANGGVADGSFVRATLTFVLGDANVDTSVDVLDAQHTINYIVGTATGFFNQAAANTFADALINVQDVVCTVNLFLDAASDGRSSSARRFTTTSSEGGPEYVGTVWAEDGYLLLSSQVPVAALDITLRGIHSDQLALNMSQKRWQLITRDTADGCRVVLLSPTGDCIDATREMGILRIAADSNLTDAVTAIDAADPSAQPLRLGTGKTTAIELASDESQESREAVYDLQGRRINGTHAAGLYIVNGQKTIIK